MILFRYEGYKMKYEVAESILRSTLGHWDLETMVQETRNIQIISEIKYDDYQQYTHGMRFVESLALWMRQFENNNEKDIAYNMVKTLLVFISEEEMRQLVANVFPGMIKKCIINKARSFCVDHNILDIEERRRIYQYYERTSLFLGLSDGAHMDYFRRQNSHLNNEQIFIHYDFSEQKSKDMEEELRNTQLIKEITDRYTNELQAQFNCIFLIDDFAGSGKSYIRREEDGWHGKIVRFLKQMKERNYDCGQTDIYLLLYLSTNKALETIRDGIKQYEEEEQAPNIQVDALQLINPIDWDANQDLYSLLKKNYQSCIGRNLPDYVDRHWKKGNGHEPYLGFSDCSLALVLSHNTHNNSLTVIWYSWGEKVDALFPRVTRHKEI